MSRNRIIRQLLLLSFTLSALQGCALLKKIQDAGVYHDPKVEVADIQLTAISMESISLGLVLDVNNPNPLPLNLAGIDYLLKVSDKTLVSGQKNDALAIEASAVSPVTLPVSLQFKDLAAIGQDLMSQDEITYLAEARVRVDIPLLGVRTFSASREGRFPVPKVPHVRAKDFKIVRLGFFDADVSVELEVENINSFDIDIQRFTYALDVNRAPWAKGATVTPLHLPAKSKQSVSVPVNLSFASMGASILNVLQSSDALGYQLTGSLNLDTSLPLLKNLTLPVNYAGQLGAEK
ncbi:MAG: LEA type 2 family protein [Hahellaceae bacterium]|nr:LEA type 2 family protein [Hahellaceae bacterium]MCP5169765.1 LEA type 2 family protein [Hahellaceae bacterium]